MARHGLQKQMAFSSDSETAIGTLQEIFEPLIEASNATVVETGVKEAEMIKYANNGFLAAKVSLINDIGNICKEFGVDAYEPAMLEAAVAVNDRQARAPALAA